MFFLTFILISQGFFVATQTITIETDYGFCEVSSCNNVFCAEKGGLCGTESCNCKKGYTSTDETNLVKCCYKQKSALSAFFLEFFVSFGSGHFYIGNMTRGIIKLSIYSFFIILVIVILIKSWLDKKNHNIANNAFRIFRIVTLISFSFLYVAWQMVDSVMFIMGGYRDKNGIELY